VLWLTLRQNQIHSRHGSDPIFYLIIWYIQPTDPSECGRELRFDFSRISYLDVPVEVPLC
jgi:hypothetical protein